MVQTDRTSYYRPTEQLMVVTLPTSDGKSQHSIGQALSPQAIADKCKRIIEDVWLVVFGRPFQLDLKCNQQRSELCGAVYNLQEAANHHKQFVEAVAEAVGVDPIDE